MDAVKNPAAAEVGVDYEYVKREEERIQCADEHFGTSYYDCYGHRNTASCACQFRV